MYKSTESKGDLESPPRMNVEKSTNIPIKILNVIINGFNETLSLNR